MHYCYILLCADNSFYVGVAEDPLRRCQEHNAGKSAHTSKFSPWKLAGYVALPDKSLALRLEKYLKSGSGRSFAKRHLLAT